MTRHGSKDALSLSQCKIHDFLTVCPVRQLIKASMFFY